MTQHSIADVFDMRSYRNAEQFSPYSISFGLQLCIYVRCMLRKGREVIVTCVSLL